MNITIDEYSCCASHTCPFDRECAQHTSAGEYRGESGFSPEIRLCGMQYVCDTADLPVVDDITYGQFPVNYNELGCGFHPIGWYTKRPAFDDRYP